MSRFRKRSKIKQGIPTDTMADISFLLIIFFMVTTVFVVYRGFPVNLPDAQEVEPLMQRRHVVSIWVGTDGRIMVDEYEADLTTVGDLVAQKLADNPRITVQIKADAATPYRLISGVIEEMKRVNALKVAFIAKKE